MKNTTQQTTRKQVSLASFINRPQTVGPVDPELVARKRRMLAMLEQAAPHFWTLTKYSALQILFAAASEDCRSFSQDLNEDIAEFFF